MAKNRYEAAGWDQLTTEQLEELLRMDYASEGDNEAAVFRILEVLEQREKENPSGRLPDVDTAWAEFQSKYNIPEGEGQSLYPSPPAPKQVAQTKPKEDAPAVASVPRPRPFFRRVVAVAAVLAVMVGSAAVAQAAGLDIFGALGRWSNDSFQFDVSPLPPLIRHALESQDIPLDLAPTWMPEGFVAGEPTVGETEFSRFVTVTYTKGEDEYCSFSIDFCTSPDAIGSIGYQKDGNPVETYTSYGKNFFIFSNLEDTTATWSDGERYVVSIWGTISSDEIKEIINSMGGINKQ